METQIRIHWVHPAEPRQIELIKELCRKSGISLTANSELAASDVYALTLQSQLEQWLAGDMAYDRAVEVAITFKMTDAALFFMLHDPDPSLDD